MSSVGIPSLFSMMEALPLLNGLDDLTPQDQILFSRFGRGHSAKIPHDTVHGAFEKIVDLHPRAIAARYGARTITYAELDATANRLANYLIERGLRPQQRVCLVVHRSIEMLVGMFAILKVGSQYVPIDGGVCREPGLEHILQDTEARYVLCLPKFECKVRQCCGKDTIVIPLDGDAEAFCSRERPHFSVSTDDGVYAIYTSGQYHYS